MKYYTDPPSALRYCTSYRCMLDRVENRSFCAAHELKYISEHGHVSPTCISSMEWYQLSFDAGKFRNRSEG